MLKKRILFAGELISSHAQSWMSLFDSYPDIEISGFNIPQSEFPVDLRYPLYGKAARWGYFKNKRRDLGRYLFDYAVNDFKPQIIHTFGAFPTAEYLLDRLETRSPKVKWVAQVRGGPDVYINRFDEHKQSILKRIMKSCDLYIADNEKNYEIARELGIDPRKIYPHGIVPGTGGVDLKKFADAKTPSQSQRQVVWTKAYEWFESKGVCVLEAIRLAFDELKDAKFIFIATNPELRTWVKLLPEKIQRQIIIHDRIPREDLLKLMKCSRVVMAPSLLEGIPNSLYESMAARSVPLFSPLETYRHLFEDKKNILYARNLYPHEISNALLTAFGSDELADEIAENNLDLIQKIANRDIIAQNVVSAYREMAL